MYSSYTTRLVSHLSEICYFYIRNKNENKIADMGVALICKVAPVIGSLQWVVKNEEKLHTVFNTNSFVKLQPNPIQSKSIQRKAWLTLFTPRNNHNPKYLTSPNIPFPLPQKKDFFLK